MTDLLVIGSDGVLGSALFNLARELDYNVAGTSRRPGAQHHFDLEEEEFVLPHCNIAFLCAATKGYKETEGNHRAFRADVDGNIRVIRHLKKHGVFIVFVSTDAVEWGGSLAYSRHKLQVESVLLSYINAAVVRPMKFFPHTVRPLCEFILEIGLQRREGIHYWGKR